jgi:NADH:ubiquinone oxidoreductase subunit H
MNISGIFSVFLAVNNIRIIFCFIVIMHCERKLTGYAARRLSAARSPEYGISRKK